MVSSSHPYFPDRHDRRRSAARRGFTLVELLVVIGVIAVLIALLIPALALVRDHSLTTKCLANLNQIGLAINTYANDHDFCLVPGDHLQVEDIIPGYPSYLGGGNCFDILADQGYIKVPIGHVQKPGDLLATDDAIYSYDSILRCPSGVQENVLSYNYPTSQTDAVGGFFFARASNITLEAVVTWYGVNAAPLQEQRGRPLPFNVLPDFASTDASQPDWRINKFNQFNDTTTLPLVFDGTWMFNDDPARINARHNRHTMTNILFADNHCETQVTSSLPNDNWYLR